MVEDLFERPPLNDADLARRMRGIEPAALRRLMLARLCRPGLTRGEAQTAGAALTRVGPEGILEDLLALVADPAATCHARLATLDVLSATAMADLQQMLRGLPPAEADEITVLPYVDFLADAKGTPALATLVTKMVLSAPSEARRSALDAIGQARRRLGVRAVDAYRDALARSEIIGDAALREPILLGLIEEADADAPGLLATLRMKAPADARPALQAALLRIATARAEGRAATAPSDLEAWAGTPDGQATLVVLVDIPNPDGSHTAVDFCLRLDQDVRNVLVVPRASPDDIARVMRELRDGSGCAFTRIPISQMAWLVDEAVARTRATGCELPDGAEAAVNLLARIPREEPLPLPSPAAGVGIDVVRKMIERRPFGAWFLDEGDLAGYGVPAPPDDRSGLEDWMPAALAVLASSRVAGRLVAMAEYMARWSSWSGAEAESGQWCAVAAGLRSDFVRSPLARAMLQGFFDPVRGRVGPSKVAAREAIRQTLKDGFFADVVAPQGIDVARLDFAEAIRLGFDVGISRLAGHERPRDEDLDVLAVDLGSVFAEHEIARAASRDPPGGGEIDRRVERAVAAHAGLPGGALALLAEYAVVGAEGLFEKVCASCPVRCLWHPHDRMDEVFFAEQRPADLRLRDGRRGRPG
ncbi:MAG: hypothetical protein HY905_09985 [Deltaproteobacteria bacterium]|nr:hypothetical protein [Deltaproteobacteria bacterium]